MNTNNKIQFTNQKYHKLLQHSSSSKLITFESLQHMPSTQKIYLDVQTSQLQNEIKQYEWRQKTELPVIKIINFDVLRS